MALRLRDLVFAREQGLARRFDVNGDKAAGLARPQLREPADVGACDVTELGIAAGRLMIGHQHQRLAVAADLNGARRNAVGHDVEVIRMGELRPVEPIGHAVGHMRQAEFGAEEGRKRLLGEIILLRAKHDAQRPIIAGEPGCCDLRLSLRCERGRYERQKIALLQHAAIDPAEMRARMRRAAAEDERRGEPAGHREIGEGARAAGPRREPLPGQEHQPHRRAARLCRRVSRQMRRRKRRAELADLRNRGQARRG